MKKYFTCFCLIIFIFTQNVFAEENGKDKKTKEIVSSEDQAKKENSAKTKKAKSSESLDKDAQKGQEELEVTEDEALEEESYLELPTGYRDISLGMEFDDAKKALKADSVFGYRGERDISLLSGKNRSLIATKGSYFIKRAWFQFYEDKLYTIIIQMDTDKLDYYSIYTKLSKKYGEPKSIDPKKSVWKDERVFMILERPLIIKYIDMPAFKSILEKHKDEKAYSDILREDFINEF